MRGYETTIPFVIGESGDVSRPAVNLNDVVEVFESPFTVENGLDLVVVINDYFIAI